MGIFDGILIASDWDGTLFCDGTVPERTQEAINYFMSEGGRFSVTSGRPPLYLAERSELLRPNTYCICYGGSLICDVESGEVLRRGELGEGAYVLIDRMLRSDVEIVKINVFYDEGIKHYTPEEYYNVCVKEGDLLKSYKVTFNCSTPDEGKRLKELCDSFGSSEYTFARSFAPYLEIMRTEYTKGVSATFLKEKLGARVLVGMGDYENDVPLFEKCDISFAVANAVEPLKNIATYVTRATVGESAAAEIIETLERMIRAGEIQVKRAN